MEGRKEGRKEGKFLDWEKKGSYDFITTTFFLQEDGEGREKEEAILEEGKRVRVLGSCFVFVVLYISPWFIVNIVMAYYFIFIILVTYVFMVLLFCVCVFYFYLLLRYYLLLRLTILDIYFIFSFYDFM